MACTWDFAADDCVLVVTEQPINKIDQNFQLGSLTWTDNGSRGITLRDGDGNSATYTEEQINGFATIALFEAFLEPLRDACAPPTSGSLPSVPTAGTATVNTTSTSGVGSTTAAAQSVAVTNTGAASGTWDGVSIPPGFSVSIEAYLDPVAEVYNRLPSIAFDATGTTFIITEVL